MTYPLNFPSQSLEKHFTNCLDYYIQDFSRKAKVTTLKRGFTREQIGLFMDAVLVACFKFLPEPDHVELKIEEYRHPKIKGLRPAWAVTVSFKPHKYPEYFHYTRHFGRRIEFCDTAEKWFKTFRR